MYKVGICGHFGGKEIFLDGQTVKTKILTDELKSNIGEDNVTCVDTYQWRKKPFKLLKQCFLICKECNNVLIIPAHNGVRVFVPLFSLFNKVFRKKLHYVVIGGWLPQFISGNNCLLYYLKRFKSILVETNTMKKELNRIGLNNIEVLPNFKRLHILKEDALIYDHVKPYKLCTFSRVMKEKGIEDAIQAILMINKEHGETIYTLDVYGQIDNNYVDCFNKLMKGAPDCIQYKGSISYDKSVEVLKKYFMLLFPTRFKTEGIPGTILDSYSAGVPVLSSKWDSFSDIVEENVTGIGFELENFDDMYDKLGYIYNNPGKILSMKKKCIKRANKYTPEKVIQALLYEIND